MSLTKSPRVELSSDELAELLGAAERAADAAAKVTLAYFRQAMHVENKAGEQAFDPVTRADKESESAIRECLLAECPTIGFYGEEHEAVRGSSGLTWVVDPIDGTRAFMSGMPLWGTLIGLFDGQRAVLGVMDQPFLQERYRGVPWGASLCDRGGEQVLETRTDRSLSQATMYCTTPDMFATEESRARFDRVRDAVQLTRYGGDCYSYALLASGHVDSVLDCDLKPYDI